MYRTPTVAMRCRLRPTPRVRRRIPTRGGWIVRLGKPSPVMVVAGLALFVALGGSSYAALKVGSGQIKNNSVRSRDLRNNDVRGRDIRQGTEADSTAGDFGAGGQ